MSKGLFGGLLAASCVMVSPAALAGDLERLLVPASRIDSGLGDLTPCVGAPEVWVYSHPAAKIDSGLGDMPQAGEVTEVWMYLQPAPKLDSGLGDAATQAMAARDMNGG